MFLGRSMDVVESLPPDWGNSMEADATPPVNLFWVNPKQLDAEESTKRRAKATHAVLAEITLITYHAHPFGFYICFLGRVNVFIYWSGRGMVQKSRSFPTPFSIARS
jgi:hypothetical protein